MKKLYHRIKDPLGLHARPAAKLAELARSYACRITIHSEDRSAVATRIVDVIELGIRHGEQICIIVNGEQEEAACQALIDFYQKYL